MSVLYIKSLGTELQEYQKENMLLRKIIKEQEKIIELMAKEINDGMFFNSKEEVIEHFRKKARTRNEIIR